MAWRRWVILGGLLSVAPAGLAHPGHTGNMLGLVITIDEQAVTYDLAAAGDMLPHLPRDSQGLTYEAAADRYRFAAAEDEAELRQTLVAFLAETNPVKIDGVRVTPVLRELTLTPSAAPEARAMPELFPPDVRIVLAHSTKGVPRQVNLVWTLFPQRPNELLLTGGANPRLFVELRALGVSKPIKFTLDEPEYVWHAPTAPPAEEVEQPLVTRTAATRPAPLALLATVLAGGLSLISVRFARARWMRGLLLGVGLGLPAVGVGFLRDVAVIDVPWPGERATLPDADRARELFTTLQRNVYRAFDYTRESDIYDVLARSVDGPLLDRLYTEIYQSLIMREEGGAVARVHAVDILEADLLAAGELGDTQDLALRMGARWRVLGVVTHWGHSHERLNEYRAIYTLAERDGAWKITQVSGVEQERIDQRDADNAAAREPGT